MKNWGGNIDYGEATVVSPASVDELAEAVASSRSCRALGSRHSFNRIAESDVIIDTSALPTSVHIADDRVSAKVSGPATYAALASALNGNGLALRNMASLPHISVAGAISTGTHGSGDRNQNLAASVCAIELLTASGETVSFERGSPDFAGVVVGLGALGVITEVTVDVVPAFEVEQTVYGGSSLEQLAASVDAVFTSGYSVSVFTHWADRADQVWVKQRVGDAVSDASSALLESLTAATVRQHPVIELDAAGCTEQLGIRGSWSDRLPHFQMGFTPSAGDEIQSEFFVDRVHAAEAILAMSSIGGGIADALMVGEIRTIAGDELWMSPHTGRDSLAFHFTWHPDNDFAKAAADLVAGTLAPFAVRAHWGKLFDPRRIDLDQYSQRSDFLALVDKLDPEGKFRNPWFAKVFH